MRIEAEVAAPRELPRLGDRISIEGIVGSFRVVGVDFAEGTLQVAHYDRDRPSARTIPTADVISMYQAIEAADVD